MKIRTRIKPDLVGQKFNMLTVIEPARMKQNCGKTRHGLWCRCQCGKVVFRTSGELLSDRTFSCGCVTRTMYSHCQTIHALPAGAKVDPIKFIPRPLMEWEPCYYGSESV